MQSELESLISVSVRYLVNFSVATGKKQEEVTLPDGATLSDLIDKLTERYGNALKKEIFGSKTGGVKPHVLILIDGRSLDQFKERVDTPLANGNSVIFTFPVTGG
jgi:MoaD family protein